MKYNILITRPKKEAENVAIALMKENFNVVIESIFSVENLPIEKLDKSPQAVVITSSNAIFALKLSNISCQTKIFTTGLQTAKKLIKIGYSNVFYSENSAQDLKNNILQKLNPNEGLVVYFCGETITIDFEKELKLVGFETKKMICYKINWNKNFSLEFLEKIRELQINSVLIYSQNSANKFCKLVKKNNLFKYFSHSKILCFSPKIKLKMKKLGYKNVGNFSENKVLKKFYDL